MPTITEYEVYDLKRYTPTAVWDSFYDELEFISQSDLPLKNNYTTDRLKLNQMLAFNVLIDKSNLKVVCFAGLQRFNDQLARVSSRYYYSQIYSEKWIRGNKRLRPNWKYFIPHQIQIARECGITGLFWSMENCKSDKFFKKISDNSLQFLEQINCSSNPLNGYYNINSSKQKVCQIILNEYPDVKLNIPEYVKHYHDPKIVIYTDNLSNKLDKAEFSKHDNNWTSDSSVIKIINLTQEDPNHPIINYLKNNYYTKLYKVMLARVLGDVPQHYDKSDEARAHPVHMKIKLGGDWSGFILKDNLTSSIIKFNNENNIMIFNNEQYTHLVKNTVFDVIIPYGELNEKNINSWGI